MRAYLTDKKSIGNVIAAMTVEEKALLITGKSKATSNAFEKFGIPAIVSLDGISGINLNQYYMEAYTQNQLAENPGIEARIREGSEGMLQINEGLAAVTEVTEKGHRAANLSPEAKEIVEYTDKNMLTNGKLPSSFPVGMALGASWDRGLVYRIGEAVGKEAAAYHIDIVLGSPNVNIQRDPRNGRLFESFSEDPFLTASLAPEIVRGVQDQGVGANVKHFAANNQETRRFDINEHIPERALYEIYLPGFKACVQQGVTSVMSAYNSINGTPCAHNKWLLTDVLKKEWGYKGYVVSDWGAVYNQVEALKAGNDVDMPGPRSISPILEAVADGRLSEKVLDEACYRYLSAVVDIIEMRKKRVKDFKREESIAAAYDLAAGSITLLKNNGVLPLSKSARVSFFGDKCDGFLACGEGSAVVVTDQKTSLVEEAAQKVGADNISFRTLQPDADVVVITIASSSSEGTDHSDLELPEDEKQMALAAIRQAKDAGKPVVLILNSAGPVETGEFIDQADALLWVYYPGMQGGRAAADILFGDVNPSGKLPLTFPKRCKDCPSYGNFPGACDEVYYGEGIFVGYRYYDLKDVEPLFPFGYGLSYTKFDITDLKLSSDTFDLDAGGELTATVKVKNTGDMAGAEVVQLDIADEISQLPKPVKELKGFEKVVLAPGEEKNIIFKIKKEYLAGYDSKYHTWVSEPGWYRALVGNSSRSVACEQRFKAYGHSEYDFGPDTMMVRILNCPEAINVIDRCFEGIIPIEAVKEQVRYMPHMPFSAVWNNIIAQAVKAAGHDPDELYAKVCDSLRKIDTGEQ